MQIEELKPYVNQVREFLFSYPYVRTVGAGNVFVDGRKTKELGIIVGVSEKLPESMLNKDDIIPQELEGTNIRVDVVRTGTCHPLYLLPVRGSLAIPDYDCSRFETMRSGVGLAHYQVTGGTLGDYKAAWDLGTTNNHVGANSNKGKKGDLIFQPSPICTVDKRAVGTLEAFKEIKFIGSGSPCSVSQGWAELSNFFMWAAHRKTRFAALKHMNPFDESSMNHVDLAFIKFFDGVPVDERIERTDWEFAGHRPEATLNEVLAKSGARTRVTEFPCIQKYATSSVQYGFGQIAMYENQDIGDNPGGEKLNAGDSGDMPFGKSDIKRTDLAFAGSSSVSILSPYMYVQEAYEELIVSRR